MKTSPQVWGEGSNKERVSAQGPPSKGWKQAALEKRGKGAAAERQIGREGQVNECWVSDSDPK